LLTRNTIAGHNRFILGSGISSQSDTFRPATVADHPPQENDAKCGFACNTVVKTTDYVFTDYGHR
jgi:hypothetical protein